MKIKSKALIALLCVLSMCFCFFACSSGSLQLNAEAQMVMSVGSTYTVKANNASGDVTWTSSDETLATVDDKGVITALKEGEVTITASTKSQSKSITVIVKETRSYTVFINGKFSQVKHGTVLTKPEDPVKEADAQYTYTFAGWYCDDAEMTWNDPVTANKVIEARYTTTVNKYNVTIGEEAPVSVEYGTVLEKPADPAKESTAAADYVFAGWYNGENRWNFNNKVTSDLVLTPKFNEIARSYKVTFDGKNASYVKYGEKLTAPATPVMAATAQYTYTFVGWYDGDKKWDFENDTVASETALVAKFEEKLNQYSVTIGETARNYDYGKKLTKPADPTMASTAQYTYTFAGWYTAAGIKWDFDNDIVTADEVLTAKFTKTVNKYTVTIDGEAKEYAYGSKVARPATPVKPADEAATYYFDKFVIKGTDTEWTFETDIVTKDVELEALFLQATNKYLVNFGNIKFEEYEYGATITRPADPIKPATAEYTYTFDHWEYEVNGERKTWNFDVDTVTEVLPGTLYPVFVSEQNTYTVYFMNGEEQVFAISDVTIGSAIGIPADPKKEDSYKYTYSFVGWYNGNFIWNSDNGITADMIQDGKIVLSARYAAELRKFIVTFDGENAAEYVYGSLVKAPANPTKEAENAEVAKKIKYEFAGWTYAGAQWNFNTGIVTGDMNFVSTFNEVARFYDIAFFNEMGQEIWTSKIRYGEPIVPIASPEKTATARYSYNFIGWTTDGSETTYDFAGAVADQDIEFYPVYETVVKKYVVTLKNYDDTIFTSDVSMEFEYEQKFEYPAYAEIPMKIIEGDNTPYAFNYWSLSKNGKEYTGLVSADMTLYAVYIVDENDYSIKYYGYEGNLIEASTQTLKYSNLLTLPDMSKAPTNESKFVFLGWATTEGGEVVYPAGKAIRCKGDMTLYGVYAEETRYYYVNVELTDTDANYVLTDVEGNALTADDLKFTYNSKVEFKAAINSEAKGNIVIRRGATVMNPDENGIYSFNIRDEQVRISVSGLVLRRYTVAGSVSLMAQSDDAALVLTKDYSDVIVKIAEGENVQYFEGAVNNGTYALSGFVAGTYEVSYVTLDGDGKYVAIANQSYTQSLNTAWAIENGQDDTMTWTVENQLVGYTPYEFDGRNNDGYYHVIGNKITSATYEKGRNTAFTYTEAAPATGDFIATVTYNQPQAPNDADGPGTGFNFGTAAGNVCIRMVDEGKLRLYLNGYGNQMFNSNVLICNVGAVLNKYGDCFTRVTCTYVKSGAYMYIFASVSRPGSQLAVITNKLMGVIDTTTGTLYTSEKIYGSSNNFTSNPLRGMGTYDVWQNDYLKSLADISSVQAAWDVTQDSPVEFYGLNYSTDKELIAQYVAMTKTTVNVTTDEHAFIRSSSNVNIKTGASNVWEAGSLTVVPSDGYVIDTVTMNGEPYTGGLNENGHLVFDFQKDFSRFGEEQVNVTTKAGNYAAYTKVTGSVMFGTTAVNDAVLEFTNGDGTITAQTDAYGEYSVLLKTGRTYDLTVTGGKYGPGKGYAIDTYGYKYNQHKATVEITGASYSYDVEMEENIAFGFLGSGRVHAGDGTFNQYFDENGKGKVTYDVVANVDYNLFRNLKDGEMLTFSFKMEENMGMNAALTAREATSQDAYFKFKLGTGNTEFQITSWGGTNGPTRDYYAFSFLKNAAQRGEFQNIYDIAYVRVGNTVHMLEKYRSETDYTFVKKADIAGGDAPVNLQVTGAGSRHINVTFSDFNITTDYQAVLNAAQRTTYRAQNRSFGMADENGTYGGFLDYSGGLYIMDQIYDKKSGSAILEGTYSGNMGAYPGVGFAMMDPTNGNFVRLYMDGSSANWQSTLEGGNGWGYRTARVSRTGIDSNAPSKDINGNKTYRLKAVFAGDAITVYVDDVCYGFVNMRSLYTSKFVGGGGSADAVNGNAKHGWAGDTEKLYPDSDKVVLGFYIHSDGSKNFTVDDVKLTFVENAAILGAPSAALNDIESAAEDTWNVYQYSGSSAWDGKWSSGKILSAGEYLSFTLRYNEANGAFKAHGATAYSDTRGYGDMYINLAAGGKAMRISSTGCAAGSWDGTNYPGATHSGNQVFDFAMDADVYYKLFSEPKYDMAVVKEANAVKLYAKFNGTSEWILFYTASGVTEAKSGVDTFYITSWGGYVFNYSITDIKTGNSDEILGHVFSDFNAVKNTSYGTVGKTVEEDGSVSWNMHVGLRRQAQFTRSRSGVKEYHDAFDTTVTYTGDYTMQLGGANASGWSTVGWFFESEGKRFFVAMCNGNFMLGLYDYGDSYGNRWSGVNAANAANGLYTVNRNAVPVRLNTIAQFSAKWEISGYRFKLYVGEYGKAATTLALDIDMQLFASKVTFSDGGTADRLWGGTASNSVDKGFPDMSRFYMGVCAVNDSVDNGTANGASAIRVYAEHVKATTVRNAWTGGDRTLYGPTYRLYTTAGGEVPSDNLWYAEVDVTQNLAGWGGILTDLYGKTQLDTSKAEQWTGFGFGYNTVWMHTGDNWSSGERLVSFNGLSTIKLGIARNGATYYMFVNGEYIGTYSSGNAAASPIGIYGGAGADGCSTVLKNFKVNLDITADQIMEKVNYRKTTTVNVGGVDRTLKKGTIGGNISFDGATYDSFDKNGLMTFKDASMNNVTVGATNYAYINGVVGHTYYVETTITSGANEGWQGLIVNTLGYEPQKNKGWISFGVGYGNTIWYHVYQGNWNEAYSIGNTDQSTTAPIRLGVARVKDTYELFINGKAWGRWTNRYDSAKDGSALPADNLSPVAIYKGAGGNAASCTMANIVYTDDEATVLSIMNERFVTKNEGDLTYWVFDDNLDRPTSEYVVSGTLVSGDVLPYNRYYGFTFGNGDHRFLLWDADMNGTFEYAYSRPWVHVHDGGLNPDEYWDFANGPLQWKVIHDGTNAYFYANGVLRLFYANAPKAGFGLENANIDAHWTNIKVITKKANPAEYDAEYQAILHIKNAMNNWTSDEVVLRVQPGVAHNSLTGDGTVFTAPSLIAGNQTNFIYETTLVITGIGGNAHFELGSSDNNRFLFWKQGDVFKATFISGTTASKTEKTWELAPCEVKMKLVVVNNVAYWWVDGELCAVNTNFDAPLRLRMEQMTGYTKNSTIISKLANEAEFNAAIAAMELPEV